MVPKFGGLAHDLIREILREEGGRGREEGMEG
jgi:hypothetical protein